MSQETEGIQLLTLVRRAKPLVGETIGDDTIVVHIETGAYYSLTPPAGALWVSATDVVEVPKGSESLAAHLLAEGLIELVEGNLPDASGGDPSEAFVKFTDMADILLADPIHDVDEDGWPTLR